MYIRRYSCPIFNKTSVFLRDFRKKNNQTANFMKIRPVAAELLHADGHTDGRADMMVFRDFANAPKNA